MKNMKFAVGGMSCAACSAHVTKAVSKLDGVEKVNVNLMANNMLVDFDEQTVSPDDICAAVKDAGYFASYDQPQEKTNDEVKQIFTRFISSLCLLLPLVYISMGHMVNLPVPHFMHDPLIFAIAQLVLTVPVLVINYRYFVNGVKGLIHGAPTMDALISIGSSASFIYGIYTIVQIALGNDTAAQHLYFESAAMIPTLITLGRFLEARSKRKTHTALAKLAALVPKTAVLVKDGVKKTVPIEEIQVGDTVEVKNGAAIPVDGVVISGEATVDEANITGESMPVSKTVGDSVTSATICTSGYMLVRAVKVGNDTLMAQIVELVEAAGASKAPIGRLADKVSGVFVPIVMSIALLTAVLWGVFGGTFDQALSAGISVLVISCPCALGLATPVAIMAGTGKSAERGVLIKDAAALEALGTVDTVVCDKTGTLTKGELFVTDVESDRADFLKLLASVEYKSEHPIAKAIVKAQGEVLETEQFATFSGLGVSAIIDGRKYLAGNLGFLSENGVDTANARLAFEKYSSQGKTPIFMAEDGVYIGTAAVADVAREGAVEAIEKLKKLGKSVYMLTGDNEVTARAVAASLGIEPKNVTAGVLPADKEKVVSSLMREGRKVAFVGDGVNDAPALTAATVGIAMHTGTEIATESADIVLMHKDLGCLVTAFKISDKTMWIIKQNLFWAFFYNSVGIPVAALGLLNPMICAAAMSLSSVTVVSNSLRLFAFKEDNKTVKCEDKCDVAVDKGEKIMERTLNIQGMMCMHCVAHVKKALEGVEGVVAVEVNLEAKNAKVQVSTATDEMLVKAVTDEGYTVLSVE